MKAMMWVCAGLSAGVLAFSGCNKKEDGASGASADAVKKEVGEAASAVGEYTAAKKDEFIAGAQRQIGELEADLAALADEAKAKGEAAQAQFAEARKTLDAKLADVRARLETARAAGADAWGEVSAGVSKSMSELKDAFGKAKQALSGAGAPAPANPPH